MHQMWTVVADVSMAWCACLYVCNAYLPCKMAEWIEVLFGVKTLRDPGHIVLAGGGGFNAAFPKLLWPWLVSSVSVTVMSIHAVVFTLKFKYMFRVYNAYVHSIIACFRFCLKYYVCLVAHLFQHTLMLLFVYYFLWSWYDEFVSNSAVSCLSRSISTRNSYVSYSISINYLRTSHAASRYCFWLHLCVCLCVCPHKISKTTYQKLTWLGRNMFHDER